MRPKKGMILSSPFKYLTVSPAFISIISGKPLPAIRVAGNFLFIASRDSSSKEKLILNLSFSSVTRDSYSGLWFSAWNQNRMGTRPWAQPSG